MDKLLELLVPLIVAIITGIIGPLILYYYKMNKQNSDKEVPKKAVIQKNVQTNKKIQTRLDDIKNKLGSDRVWIAEFHNGGKLFSNDSSLQKLSITFESVSPGVSAEIRHFSNLLVSFFSSTIEELLKNKCLIYNSIEDTDNYEIVRIFEQKGNSSMYMFSLETIDGYLVGMLGVDFVRDSHKITDAEKNFLRDQASLLAGYIETRINN